MKNLVNPSQVVVIGASDSPQNLARNIVHNLIEFGYRGGIYLLGRKEGFLYGHKIHTSFDPLPDGLDLAVLLVPAVHVPRYLEQCGQKGIKMAVIESGGFGEFDDQRKQLEQQLIDIAERYDMRFTGPNCLGVISYHSGLALPFIQLEPTGLPPGRTSLLAQSGGVGIYFINAFAEANIPIDRFVSLGNKLNIDETDLLRDLRQHHQPDCVCLYLEDIKRGREFYDELKQCEFPVLVQKANTTEAGSRIAQSHTASVAGDDRVISFMLKQAGATRVRDMRSMTNLAVAMRMPPMHGNNLAVVSRSGGHAVIAADLAEHFGFHLPQPSAQTAAEFASYFRAHVIKPINPFDLGDLFDFEVYVKIIENTLADPQIDGVVFIHTYHPQREGETSQKLLHTCAQIAQNSPKPLYVCVVTENSEIERVKKSSKSTIFSDPEDALRALAASRDYAQRRAKIRTEQLVDAKLDNPRQIAKLIGDAQDQGKKLLTWEALEIVAAAGINVAPFGVATDLDRVEDIAHRIGTPLALKILSQDISHKYDVGGVALNLWSIDDVVTRAKQMHESIVEQRPDAKIDGFLLQRMASGYREVFLGGKRDAAFGPLMMVGLGGIYVDLFKDISIRLLPLSQYDLSQMIEEVVSFKSFKQFRGQPPADIPFLLDAMAKLAALISTHPQILEIDLNPMKLHRQGRGGTVVDARILLA
jgi:acetyltransferase